MATGALGGEEEGAALRRLMTDMTALLTEDPEESAVLGAACATGALGDFVLYIGCLSLTYALRDVLGFDPQLHFGVSSCQYHALAAAGLKWDAAIKGATVKQYEIRG